MDSSLLPLILSMFVGQVPVLLVSLLACIVLLTKWKEASSGATWALAGFGLSLILCFAIPLSQAIVQQWVVQAGSTVASRAPILAGLSIVWSLLRAVSYALLLVAVLAGRTAPAPAHDIPLRQP